MLTFFFTIPAVALRQRFLQAATAKKSISISNIPTGSTALPTQTVVSYVHTGANLCRNSFTAKEVAAFNHPMQYQAMHISRAIPDIIVCLMAGDRYGAKNNFHHMAGAFGMAKINFHYMAGACHKAKNDFDDMADACHKAKNDFHHLAGACHKAKINFHYMAGACHKAKNNFHYMSGARHRTKQDFHYMLGACGAVHSHFYRIGGGANEGY